MVGIRRFASGDSMRESSQSVTGRESSRSIERSSRRLSDASSCTPIATIDTTGDGLVDSVTFDTTGDGLADARRPLHFSAESGEGQSGPVLPVELRGERRKSAMLLGEVHIDTTGDGSENLVMSLRDLGIRAKEQQGVDTVGDGEADATRLVHRDGSSRVDLVLTNKKAMVVPAG